MDAQAADAPALCSGTCTDFEGWLRGLDGGSGCMLQYLEPLQQEFESLLQVAAAMMPVPDGASVVDGVDPLVFEVLGVPPGPYR